MYHRGHHQHRRYHHRRRRLQRQRWMLYLAFFAASAGASFLIALHPPGRWLPQPGSAAENPADDLFDARSSFAVDPAVAGGRLVYPYSVIPGGVRSPQELKEEIARDPVVAAHYADFDVARARAIRLPSDRLVYVSYRIGNQIFWTKKRLRIPKGEPLLSDGIHFARMRCGNQLSPKPQERISAFEPTPQALETPVPVAPAPLVGPPPGVPGSAPVVASLEGPAPPPPAIAGPAAPPPAGGFTVIPPPPGSPTTFHGGPPPLPPGGIIIPAPPGVPPKHKHQKKPPLPPVPEPGTVLLVSSGLAWLAYRKRSKGRLT